MVKQMFDCICSALKKISVYQPCVSYPKEHFDKVNVYDCKNILESYYSARQVYNSGLKETQNHCMLKPRLFIE